MGARAFSSEVDTGSREENASNKEIEPPFRFNRNGKGSRYQIPIHPRHQQRGPQLTRKQMQFKHATLDIDGPVAVLKLDHQEVMNAVSVDMLGGLGEALDAIDDRRVEVRCLVITGAGRAFCTGAN